MIRILVAVVLAVVSISRAAAQWHASPFPAVAPAVGYVLEQTLESPTFGPPYRPIGFSSHNGRMFFTDRNGRVLIQTNATAPVAVFIDLTATSWNFLDSGLMGFAMHPNGRTCYTFGNETNKLATNMVMRLRKWTVNPTDPNRVLTPSEILIEQPDRENQHTGGDVAFGPDGYLYVTLGDEGAQDCSFGQCQTITKDFFAGLIRIDVDGRPGSLAPNPHPSIKGTYRIPPDNPWVGATSFNGSPVDPTRVRTEFWAVGLRNPWKITFDGQECYVADVGSVRWEELNRIVRGGNYGWNWYEGNDTTTTRANPNVVLQPPLWTYPHSAIAPPGTDPRFIGNCIVGGFVYRGSRYPHLYGKMICADFISMNIWAVTLSPTLVIERIAVSGQALTAIGYNPWTDEIVFGEFATRRHFKLVPAPDTSSVPATLSATGVFSDLATLTPAAGILPYEVANPFWSDHAVKTRWFFLPPGTQVTRTVADEWQFPAGTVWVKHFDLPEVRGTSQTRRIETRFTIKTQAGLYGLTYRWRDDQTDADLVPDSGQDVAFPVQSAGVDFDQPWHYPGRTECLNCHNPVAGYVLGFSTRQLNVPVSVETGGTVQQLLGLTALGVFNPPFTTVTGLPRLSRPADETATLEHRFKSYTDANCSYCHRPGGSTRTEWDARFSTPVASSQIISGPVLDTLGVPGSTVIAPGDTDHSILYRRVADFIGDQVPAAYHMPPLATFQRNDAAVSLLERYIGSLAPRTRWQVGTNSTLRSQAAVEFSSENRINDPAPGTLALDDDYYTAGSYPAGFNRLTAPLTVPADEPWSHWERANTQKDRTNRLHFVTGAGVATAAITFASGGSMLNGVTQSGFASHDIVVLHIGGGATNTVWQGTVTRATTINASFPTAAGANTLAIIRTGPNAPNTSYWIVYDSVDIHR